MRVLRIKPLYVPQEKEGVKEIYYPTWLYVFKYTVKRRIFGDIKGIVVVLVDGINRRAYLADIFPEIEEAEFDGKILTPVISDRESEVLARDKIEEYLFRKFSYLKFSYTLKQKAFSYKLFWAKKGKNGQYYLLDSITGDEIEVQKIEKSEEVINNISQNS
jgi:hypothetical protein